MLCPRTLKLTLAYDGTAYRGWQRQAGGVSIQGLLEEALSRIEGAPVTVHGAGRTDAGVHALGQVASATLATALDTRTLRRALNATLPADVRVVAVDEAPDGFHARFSAIGKTYEYWIFEGEVQPPFARAWSWHRPYRLDVAAMDGAARALAGHPRLRGVPVHRHRREVCRPDDDTRQRAIRARARRPDRPHRRGTRAPPLRPAMPAASS